MENIKIPVWLLTICAFVFIGIVLEQLYFSKRPVDLWGLKLNQEALLDNPSPKDGLDILASDIASDSLGIYQDTIELKDKSLLFLQAFGHATTKSKNVVNSGVATFIRVNGENCGVNQSFEGSTSSVTFYAGATCVKLLMPGKHKLEAKRNDEKGINIPGKFEVQYYVVKVAKG